MCGGGGGGGGARGGGGVGATLRICDAPNMRQGFIMVACTLKHTLQANVSIVVNLIVKGHIHLSVIILRTHLGGGGYGPLPSPWLRHPKQIFYQVAIAANCILRVDLHYAAERVALPLARLGI